MLPMGSFLALIVMPSARASISRTMSATSRFFCPGSRSLNEPGVLREPAGIQKQRFVNSSQSAPYFPQILQGDRLPTARVVGDGDHHQGDIRPTHLQAVTGAPRYPCCP